jgi:hypothetical protein
MGTWVGHGLRCLFSTAKVVVEALVGGEVKPGDLFVVELPIAVLEKTHAEKVESGIDV